MEYDRRVQYDLKNLSEHETSAIQAGLTLLANSGRAGTLSYPEYKETAAGMLGKMDVNGYNHDQSTRRPATDVPEERYP